MPPNKRIHPVSFGLFILTASNVDLFDHIKYNFTLYSNNPWENASDYAPHCDCYSNCQLQQSRDNPIHTTQFPRQDNIHLNQLKLYCARLKHLLLLLLFCCYCCCCCRCCCWGSSCFYCFVVAAAAVAKTRLSWFVNCSSCLWAEI